MTENEKLRALLAEARDYVGVAWGRMSQDGHRDAAEKAGGVAKRIDAALAEPVVDCSTCDSMSMSYARMERERDDAQVEARRAYQRGAEAMREAAAAELDRLLTQKKATAIWVGPDEIRAVPLPERMP
jgi:hypothetical protein